MSPLPVEGTLFAETYRSEATAPSGGPAGTAGVGLFCDDPPSRSLFHRLAFDEVWHFYAGDPLRLVLLHPDGSDEEVVLGGDAAGSGAARRSRPASGRRASSCPAATWALFGCTMAPGFTPECFEGGSVASCSRRTRRAPPTSSGSESAR